MMYKSRVFYAKQNLLFGVIRQIVAVSAPFITRTVMIKTLGAEYTGLDGVFKSILMIFNVAELGFATAISFYLYTPLAVRDASEVCKFVCYLNKIYKGIGIAISVCSFIMLPFLEFLIRGGTPEDLNLYMLFMLTVSYNVAGYLLFAYKEVLVVAAQRQDIVSKIDIVIIAFQMIAQSASLLLLNDYYLFLLIQVVSVLGRNLLIGHVADKLFPQYLRKNNLPKEKKDAIYEHIKGIIIGRLTSLSRNGFDVIFISALCGLHYVTIYQNYYYVYAAICSLMGVVTKSIIASVGDSIARENKDKNYVDYQNLDFLYWIVRVVIAVILVLTYQLFMDLWVGKELMFDDRVMVLFVIYFYIVTAGGIRSAYIAGSGIWGKLQRINLMECLSNIVLNYMLGVYWGIMGIIIASILTVLIFSIYGNSIVLIKEYFRTEMSVYFYELTKQNFIGLSFVLLAWWASYVWGASYDWKIMIKIGLTILGCFVAILMLDSKYKRQVKWVRAIVR